VDQNTIFGTIGVSNAVSSLSSASVDVQIGGSYRAGETTYYDFSFKLNVKLIAGSWIKFTFPDDGYVISSSPDCYSVMVDRVMV